MQLTVMRPVNLEGAFTPWNFSGQSDMFVKHAVSWLPGALLLLRRRAYSVQCCALADSQRQFRDDTLIMPALPLPEA